MQHEIMEQPMNKAPETSTGESLRGSGLSRKSLASFPTIVQVSAFDAFAVTSSAMELAIKYLIRNLDLQPDEVWELVLGGRKLPTQETSTCWSPEASRETLLDF